MKNKDNTQHINNINNTNNNTITETKNHMKQNNNIDNHK